MPTIVEFLTVVQEMSNCQKTRILFIHANREESPEYNVHRTLAEYVNPHQVDCYFVWQDHTHDHSKNRPAQLHQPGHNFFYDFGRNLSLVPKPGRLHRGAMMLRRLPGALVFLKKKVQQIKPDIIYTSQQNYDIQLARFLCIIFRIPHVIHIHYPIDPSLGRGALRAILKTPRLLAVSEFVRQGVIGAGVPPQHIDVVLNAADLKRFDNPKDRHTLRTERGWPLETPLVVAAGRLDPSKGHLRLFDAFAKVHEQMPETRLLICGSSTTRYNYDLLLRNRVAELQLEDYVTFAGQRDDMPTIFAGADVFCLPTEDEAFGLVFLEAMIAAVPVVACSSGGVPEVVKDQATGLLSRLGDANELAANLLKLLRDQQLAQQLGMGGKERAHSVFAPDKIAAEWSELLKQMLHKQR
jgi:glycosyltransferase involved in cell wall biosynthesis